MVYFLNEQSFKYMKNWYRMYVDQLDMSVLISLV